jgi:Tol biopolymer transport system component
LGSLAPLLAVRQMARPPIFRNPDPARAAEARFLPDGSGLIYMQGLSPSQDFWLLDWATKKSRQLTRLDRKGSTPSFDITPDGKTIVFDRLRDNSDIVLIDLR